MGRAGQGRAGRGAAPVSGEGREGAVLPRRGRTPDAPPRPTPPPPQSGARVMGKGETRARRPARSFYRLPPHRTVGAGPVGGWGLGPRAAGAAGVAGQRRAPGPTESQGRWGGAARESWEGPRGAAAGPWALGRRGAGVGRGAAPDPGSSGTGVGRRHLSGPRTGAACRARSGPSAAAAAVTAAAAALSRPARAPPPP